MKKPRIIQRSSINKDTLIKYGFNHDMLQEDKPIKKEIIQCCSDPEIRCNYCIHCGTFWNIYDYVILTEKDVSEHDKIEMFCHYPE